MTGLREDPRRPKGIGKTGGRKKGTPNKTTVELREFFSSVLRDPAYWARLLARAKLGTLPPPVEIALWHYEMGKPKDTIDQRLDLRVQHTLESAAKLARSLSTEQLMELEALFARQEAILDGPSKLLQSVTLEERVTSSGSNPAPR
jgi:hypothetical protein